VKLKPSTLVYWLLAGLVLGLSASQFLVSTGSRFPASELNLQITLVAIGLGIFLATLPIARYRRQVEKQPDARLKRPNPLVSFRLFTLARSINLTSAGFIGWHLGQISWLFAFSVSPQGLVTPSVLGVVSSILMLLGGVLAESNCRLPKDPEDGAAA
jgi:hypothetical protein